MKPSGRYWLIGAAGVAGLIVLSWSGGRRGVAVRSEGLNSLKGSRPFVQVADFQERGSREASLEERAKYFDPTPLFIPSAENFEQRALPSRALPQPEQVFQEFPPKWVFGDEKLKGYGGANPERGPEGMGDFVAYASSASGAFSGFGRGDSSLTVRQRATTFVEVRSLADGEVVQKKEFESIYGGDLDGAPIEFLIVVEAAGPVGAPLLTSGSGVDEIDVAARRFLGEWLKVGADIPPGSYRVVVGR